MCYLSQIRKKQSNPQINRKPSLFLIACQTHSSLCTEKYKPREGPVHHPKRNYFSFLFFFSIISFPIPCRIHLKERCCLILFFSGPNMKFTPYCVSFWVIWIHQTAMCNRTAGESPRSGVLWSRFKPFPHHLCHLEEAL